MAAQYDGSIRINTNIDTKGAKVKLAALQHAIVGTANEIASLRSKMDALKDAKVPTKEFTELDAELKKAVAEYEKLQAKMEEPGKPTGIYKSLEKDLQKAQERLGKLTESQAEMKEMGLPLTQYSIQELADASKKVEEIKAKMESLKGEGKAFIPKVDAKELDEAKKKVDDLNQKMKELKATGKDTTLGINTDEYANLSKQLKYEQKALVKYTAQYMAAGVSAVISKAKSAYGKLSSIAKKAFSKVTEKIRQSSKETSTFGARLKSLALSMLIFNQISKAFRSMGSAIKEGFGNMYKNVDSFRGAVDGLKASSLTLKNSFAAAFRPLVEIAIPYIQRTIDALSSLLNMIGQFTAAITGQKTYTKAIKQTTAAIEEESKAQNKQLSGLDKLNNLSSGSGGDGASGGGGTMFEEEVPISSGILGIYQNIKDLIEGEDWEGLGAYIANALNQGLQKVYDVINWNNVGPHVTAFIDAFTESFNSLADKFDWDLLGRTIGTGINTITNSLYLFITGIDWVNLGNKLAEGINGLVSEVDPAKLGQLIGEKLMILPRILLGFVSNLDWGALGRSIGTFLANIDWGTIIYQALTVLFTLPKVLFETLSGAIQAINWGQLVTDVAVAIKNFFTEYDWAGWFYSLGELVGAAFAAVFDIAGVVGEAIMNAVDSLAHYFLGYIMESLSGLDEDANILDIGVAIIQGMFNGILNALANIGNWIWENIFSPFIEGFKNAFGIHSPSTVMMEMGTFLMEGLFQGISSLVSDVISIFEDIKSGISERWQSIKANSLEVWEQIKGNLTEKWRNIKENARTTFENTKANIANSWRSIRSDTESSWSRIVSSVSNSANRAKENVQRAWDAMKSGSIRIWTALSTAIKSPINSILGAVERLANGVINGINVMISALNSIHFSIPDWVPGLGGKSFGFNLGYLGNISIPRLATGTVVPPNNEFLAVLGDNKREPEVVSPLSTIEQAVENVMSRMGGFGGREVTIKVPVIIDGREVTEIVAKYDKEHFDRTGQPLFSF